MNEQTGEGYGRDWTAVAEERGWLRPSHKLLADRLCAADRARDSIAAVLDEASDRFEHCILFRVQDNVATVWDARGWVDRTQALAKFTSSAVSGNPLELLTIHPAYRGSTPFEPAYVPFFQQLGLPFPSQISLTPIEVAGRVVAILYGDAGEHLPLPGSKQEDLALAGRLSLGLTLVLIKNKIRAFGDA